MIHTVHLDDELTDVKEILSDIHRQKDGVHFENPVFNNNTPKEYITSEEFRKQAIKKVNTFCKKNGIL